ncbi:MAG: hypothetical protein ACXVRA_06175 [Gaiellaceae bacterium]
MNARRIACALALPAFPVALLAGTLVSPTDSTQNAVQLRAASAHGSAWAAAALFELIAAVVMPLAVAGVVHAVRVRGATLATVGGGLGVLGTVGMAAIAFRHVYIYGLAAIGHLQALHALDRVDHTFGPAVLPLMFFGPVAFVLLAAAATRAQIAPRWLPAGAFVFFVADMLPIPGAEIIQQVIGIATFTMLARSVLTAVPEPQPEEARAAMRLASAEI